MDYGHVIVLGISAMTVSATRRSWFAIWRWPRWMLIASVTLAIFLSYQGLYFAIVDEALSATIKSGTFLLCPAPDYSCGNRIPAKWSRQFTQFFVPAHELDRSIRREKWSPLLHQLTPQELESGFVEFQLKPAWKRHLPPNQQTLSIRMDLPVQPIVTGTTASQE